MYMFIHVNTRNTIFNNSYTSLLYLLCVTTRILKVQTFEIFSIYNFSPVVLAWLKHSHSQHHASVVASLYTSLRFVLRFRRFSSSLRSSFLFSHSALVTRAVQTVAVSFVRGNLVNVLRRDWSPVDLRDSVRVLIGR